MSDVNSLIIFNAQVYKVQTLVDNGIRVTLDLAETETVTMARLAECQRFGVMLQISATPDLQERTGRVEQMETGRKRKSKWTPAEE